MCSIGHVENHVGNAVYTLRNLYCNREVRFFFSCQKCVVSDVLGGVTSKFIYMYLISRCRFHMMYLSKEKFLAVR